METLDRGRGRVGLPLEEGVRKGADGRKREEDIAESEEEEEVWRRKRE